MENHILIHQEPFQLEAGGTLSSLRICYSTWGNLNASKDNVIWICHALTANSDAATWWPGMVGEGKIFNPDHHFIVCANALASCYGTSGPLDIDASTGKPFYHTFPEVTIRDMVNAHIILKEHLQLAKIHTCIGGSLGGQQALEWSIMQPELITNLVLLATNALHSPWGIAFNESQRLAIKADPTWSEASEHAGENGLKAARAVALLSYRNYQTYSHTQAETDANKIGNYKASSYQNYQGEKLIKRFNCHAYLGLTLAMDSHHVGRSRGSVEAALEKIQSKALIIGIKSDILFPVQEQVFLSTHIKNSTYSEIDSLYGHDGFLIETQKISTLLNTFLFNKSVNAYNNQRI